MLAQQVPCAAVCVSPDRHLAGTLAERQLGCTVHILDDGFQHLELGRSLDILVTMVGEIPQGRVLPKGRLREPMDAAARAQVLVVSDATAGAASAEAWALGIQSSCGALRSLAPPVEVVPRASSLAPGGPVVAVAGIANPGRFTAALRDAGWNVVGDVTFPDHHRYAPRDVATIAERVTSAGAEAVFTTDKDAVRFAALPSLPFPLYRVPLQVTFEPADALFESVRAVLA
jgi:tetraacyldisaccharide 4'-kinase